MSLSPYHQHSLFVINLDRSPERLAHMQQLFSSHQILFTRVAGVDGKTLTEAELADVYEPEHCKKLIGRELRLGEIGCTLSHIKVWKKIVADKLDGAFIFEDDITFTDGSDLANALGVSQLFRDEPAVFLLSPHSETLSAPLNDDDQPFRVFRSKRSALACGYYVNHNAAKNLIRYFNKVHHVNDWWASIRRRKMITSYLVQTPNGQPFVTQLPADDFPSNLCDQAQRGTQKPSVLTKLARKYYAYSYFRQHLKH